MEVSRVHRTICWAAMGIAVTVFMTGCTALFGVVYMPDRALESAVRASLDRPFLWLTKRDMAQVREIQAPSRGVANLEGLQYCTGMTVLNLRGNKVTSLTKLNGLRNIERLDVGENQIKNIDAVAGMIYLKELVLYGEFNEIVDWRPLAANVQAGGLGEGDTVVLPQKTTMDASGNPLPGFADTYQILLDRGVRVIIGEPDSAA